MDWSALREYAALVADRWRAILIGLIVALVGIGLDVGQTTGIILVYVSVQVGRVLWIAALIAIALVAPFQAFQKVRRERDEALAKLASSSDSEVDWAIAELDKRTVVYGGNNTLPLARVFFILAESFASGLSDRHFISGNPFEEKIGEGWSQEAKRTVLEGLQLVGVVHAEYRQPAQASPSGGYRRILAIPYYVYFTTDLGRKVYQRLSFSMPW